MIYKIRTLLFILILISLVIVPYSLLAWSCYAGLCGGLPAAEIGANYAVFYGYFSWIYLLIVVASLYFSRQLKKRDAIKQSVYCLLIPFVALIPFAYVELQATLIQNKYDNERKQYNTAQPDDYVCSPGKFIRYHHDGHYYFFNYDVKGETGSMSGFDSETALKNALLQQSIQVENCVNQKGDILEDHS
jgi:hypothetical protein